MVDMADVSREVGRYTRCFSLYLSQRTTGHTASSPRGVIPAIPTVAPLGVSLSMAARGTVHAASTGMEAEAYSIKRRRSPSLSSSEAGDDASVSSRSPSPAPKYHRSGAGDEQQGNAFVCNLPPTCSQVHTSTSFATQAELQRHQETFHKWVCRVPVKDRYKPGATSSGVPEAFVSKKKGWEWKECAKVFPDERLLNLVSKER